MNFKKYNISHIFVILFFFFSSCSKEECNKFLDAQIGNWKLQGVQEYYKRDTLLNSSPLIFSGLELFEDGTGVLYAEGFREPENIQWDVFNNGKNIHIITKETHFFTGEEQLNYKKFNILENQNNTQVFEYNLTIIRQTDPVPLIQIERWTLTRE